MSKLTNGSISCSGIFSKQHKKSELMLMKCARAYSSSCLQVILVYLHPFRRISLFFSKKSLKTHIFRVQGQSRSTMLTILRSPSPVLVMLSSMSVPICNHFHVRRANNGKITLFKGVYLFLPLVRGDHLYPAA